MHDFSYRDTVSADFMAACQFLKDHMDNMDNPNDDMVNSPDSSTETNQFKMKTAYINMLFLI